MICEENAVCHLTAEQPISLEDLIAGKPGEGTRPTSGCFGPTARDSSAQANGLGNGE